MTDKLSILGETTITVGNHVFRVCALSDGEYALDEDDLADFLESGASLDELRALSEALNRRQ
jgi:hypothetical protein